MIARVARLKLPPDVKGHSLVDFLSGRFTYLNREQWTEAVLSGRVQLDGLPAALDSVLRWNQILEYFPPERPEPPVCRNVQLLYADDTYIALNKPANLPCHPAGGFFNNTLWAVLKEGEVPGLAPLEEVHFISRLDRETSGVVLLARNGKAHTEAMKKMRSLKTEKRYLVVVEGNFPETLEAEGFLYHDSCSAVEKSRMFSTKRPPEGVTAEYAHTSFVCRCRNKGLSYLEAVLHTGRFHQIRATLHSLGFPVLGDKLYGPDETIYLRFSNRGVTAEDWRKLQIPRQALHAWRLEFDGIAVEAPRPADFPWWE